MDHCQKSKKTDYLFLVSASLVLFSICLELVPTYSPFEKTSLYLVTHSVLSLISQMAWGFVVGLLFLFFVGLLPQSFVMQILGSHKGISGIFRATLAGILLDLCSHGILLIAMKLYQKGARIGQVMAFLIASPWNSLTLLFLLWSLVGGLWMLAFLLLSFFVAIISGIIFDKLVQKGIISENIHHHQVASPSQKWRHIFHDYYKDTHFDGAFFIRHLGSTLKESRIILRWVFFGIIISSLIKGLVPDPFFQNYFGPTMLGLWLTLCAATIIEVCSEGSLPIAADLMIRAHAPGNAFAFLMSGAATDYTEIMVLKETTKSWKIAFLLPIVTLPQILILGMILNQMS